MLVNKVDWKSLSISINRITMKAMELSQFFKGIKVLEIANVLAGPLVGTFLGELGAEVIKIENKHSGGDMTRNWRLKNEDKDRSFSAYYCSANNHKLTHIMDLGLKEDKERVISWIAEVDIVLSNLKPSSAKAFGLDHQTVHALNPSIIYAELFAFGGENERPAYDVLLQAEAGFLNMTGPKGGEPVKMPVALIDLLAAHHLKEAILLAMIHKFRTGEGAWVSTSLFQSAVSSLANQASNWLMEGFIPQKIGMQHPNIAPYGDILFGKDQEGIVLAVGTDKQFEALCKVMEAEALVLDPQFATNPARVANRKSLIDALQNKAQKFDGSTLMEKFLNAAVPSAKIRNLEEVFNLPEAQQLVEESSMEGITGKRVKTIPFSIQPIPVSQ